MSSVASAHLSEESTLPHKLLLSSSLFMLIALISWFMPVTGPMWDQVDCTVFYSLNQILVIAPNWQWSVAWLNSRYGDWLFDVLVLYVFLSPYTQKRTLTFKQRALQLFSMILFVALFQIVINKNLIPKIIGIHRSSPSLILGSLADLSTFDYPHNRTFSYASFPADHATTLFICILVSRYLFTRNTSIWFSVACLFFSLPRLIVGAHWFTDVFFGGLGLALIAWLLLFPLRLRNKMFY